MLPCISSEPPSSCTTSRKVVPTRPGVFSRISVPETLVIQCMACSGSPSQPKTASGVLWMSMDVEIFISSSALAVCSPLARQLSQPLQQQEGCQGQQRRDQEPEPEVQEQDDAGD